MAEENVVKEVVKETPVAVPTEQPKTETTPTPSGEVVKETPKESADRVPYSRFSEVIAQKNEEKKRADEWQKKYDEISRRYTPKPQAEETDPFAGLSPEDREQTKKFVNTFVKPDVKKELLQELAPYIDKMQQNMVKEQVNEAKDVANKVGINFDERFPELMDFLLRPENKGRLTAKEALLSLYGEEILEKSRLKGKEEFSQETKELIEKKKLANMQVTSVNPNSVVQSDEMARKQMTPQERLAYDIEKAMELGRQGVKNPKVRG